MPAKRINFMGLPLALEEHAPYKVVSLPYEETTAYLNGTKDAPLRVMQESLNVETYDMGVNPAAKGIATQWLSHPREYKPSKTFDVILGGEHTITYYTASKHSIDSIFVFDAHIDAYSEYMGRRLAHATWLRRYVEEHKVEVWLSGIRVGSEEEWLFAREQGIHMNDASMPKGKRIYLSIDVDVLDISAMPCASNPEPAGLSWETLLAFIEMLFAHNNIVAVDVVEHKPCKELPQFSYAVAKLIYRLFALKERFAQSETL